MIHYPLKLYVMTMGKNLSELVSYKASKMFFKGDIKKPKQTNQPNKTNQKPKPPNKKPVTYLAK